MNKTDRTGSCSAVRRLLRICYLPMLMIGGSCAGPQPLSMAINPRDEAAYVAQLNSANADAKLAFTTWMAEGRRTSRESILQSDSELSQSKNPFSAKRDQTSVSRGAVTYKMHCARCHGEDSRGDGPSLLPNHPAKSFKTFGKRFAATLHGGAPRKWFRVIRDGSGDVVDYPDGQMTAMPAFGDKLTREQIWLVITYLQSLDCYAANDKMR